MPLQIVRQNITKMKVDAIVNMTNEAIECCGDADEATCAVACRKHGHTGLGMAKLAKEGATNAAYVIHTSHPVWRGGFQEECVLLKSCYAEALKLAVQYGCSSVAFPLMSSGVCGYPTEQMLTFAVQTISKLLFDYELTVYLCVPQKAPHTFSKERFADIQKFIDDGHSKKEKRIEAFFSDKTFAPEECLPDARPAPKRSVCTSAQNKTLQEYMQSMDKPFAYKLFDLIDARGMTDVECYKKANVDKKTFSKIKCNPDTYRPSKQTAVAFAIALRLNLEETQELLASAGMTLSRSFVFDKIIRYFIQKGIYDIFEINEALFAFDQVLLGC